MRMDTIINDVKIMFRRAKVFFRATANKILSSKTKVDDETELQPVSSAVVGVITTDPVIVPEIIKEPEEPIKESEEVIE